MANRESSYLAEEFLSNICPCFAIAQLGVITRTRNKFIEIIVVAERCLVMTDIPKKELKKQPFRIYLTVILAIGRISTK